MKKLPALALSLLLLAPALPAAAAGPGEVVSRTELLSEKSEPLSAADAALLAGRAAPGEKAVFVPALIILAGAKAWNVIVKGRPSADLASAYASAIPGFQFNWDDLNGWRKVTRKYRFRMGNAIQGDDAVDITYEVSFFHGSLAIPGSKVAKGHYIANFVIKPESINLKWGWKVSLTAAMSDPMNIGTAEEPVAMLNADLKWQYTKPFTSIPEIGMDSVAVDGLGHLQASGDGRLDLPPVNPGAQPDVPQGVTWD